MAEPVVIAVIDDDESLRGALVALVRSRGYEARGFESAEDFLNGPRDAVGCIVTDIQMPGMSGIELKRHLVAEGRDVPTIMITARAEKGLEERARASGALGFLKKPLEANRLAECIERALKTCP